MTFREKYMNGEVNFDTIFDETEVWNFSDETCTLREYLGLTAEEEDVWISDSDEALEALLEKERNRKILFLDLDGTLLTDDKTFSAGNRKAIKAALQAGHMIVLSTGRPLVSALSLAEELQLTGKGCYLITYNGGEIYDTYQKKSIFKKTIPLSQVRYIFNAAKSMGLHCQTYNNVEILSEADTPALRFYQNHTKMQAQIVSDVTQALLEEPVKMIVIDIKDQNKLLQYEEATADWCRGKLDRVLSTPEYLEHIPTGISKGDAICRLCSYLNLPLSATIAVGDAPNDLSMIETAAIGVAMANADDEVKAAADYVTKRTNNEDGVSEVIGKFLS